MTRAGLPDAPSYSAVRTLLQAAFLFTLIVKATVVILGT